jgi:ribosomal protein S13
MALDCKSESAACMTEDMTARLNEVIEALERAIDVTARCNLGVAAELLRMARLDLLMRVYEITDEELQVLREALDNAKRTGSEKKIALRTRSSISRDESDKCR